MIDPARQRPVQLDTRFTPADHDPMIIASLLSDEVRQRRETGFDVDDVVSAANNLELEDSDEILKLVDAMTDAHRGPWPWDEPESLSDIEASLVDRPRPALPITRRLADQVHGGWLGRIIGCNMGKPLEWGDHWTPAHIKDYLTAADAYPLIDYVPVLDPMPARFDLNASWIHAAKGRVHGGARDDDIDYSLLALRMLEIHGRSIRPDLAGGLWTELLPLRQTYTAERAAYINLARGLRPTATATFRNPYREWIGAQIRADVFGYVNPGDPGAAARLAYQDATLSHTGNGVYGAMWAAALVAAAFTADDARAAVEDSLPVIPPGSRLAAAIRHVCDLADRQLTWEDAVAEVRATYGDYSWVHTINNAAVVVTGLLWGDDFTTAVGRTVMAGWDTDSNAATVGSVAGILSGASGIPSHLAEPLHDWTRSALFGHDDTKISALATRTLSVLDSLNNR